MQPSFRYGLLASFSLYGVVSAAKCTSNLLIDDFSRRPTSNNNLGGYTNDDGSMKSITVQGTSLILTPRQPAPGGLSPSYYYENMPCTQAAGDGYEALSFTIKAPSRGSNFTLEIQTFSSCGDTSYTMDWQVVKGLTGDVQTVTIPLAGWVNPKTNLNAVKAFNWATWTSPTQGNGDEQWQLGDIMFVCGDADEPTTSSTSSTSSDAAPTSTSASSSSSLSTSVSSETPTTSLGPARSSSTSSGFVTSTITPTSSSTRSLQSSTSRTSTTSLPPSTLRTSTTTSSSRSSTTSTSSSTSTSKSSTTSTSSSTSSSRTSSTTSLTTARPTTSTTTTTTRPTTPTPTTPTPRPPQPTPTRKVFCILPGWCF